MMSIKNKHQLTQSLSVMDYHQIISRRIFVVHAEIALKRFSLLPSAGKSEFDVISLSNPTINKNK